MKRNHVISFYFTIIIIILGLFCLLQPKIKAKIGLKNNKLLDTFIRETIINKKINVQEFWKLREFYCPGSFIFDRNKPTFLTYSCNYLKSYDSLVSESTIIVSKEIKQKDIIVNNRNVLITKDKQDIIILFIVRTEEMEKANGFFDYKEKDKKLLKNKYWLDKTIIISHK
jgi:hypothetical protein